MIHNPHHCLSDISALYINVSGGYKSKLPTLKRVGMAYDAIIYFKKTKWLTLQFYFFQEKFEESSEISLPDFFAPEKYRHDKAL